MRLLSLPLFENAYTAKLVPDAYTVLPMEGRVLFGRGRNILESVAGGTEASWGKEEGIPAEVPGRRLDGMLWVWLKVLAVYELGVGDGCTVSVYGEEKKPCRTCAEDEDAGRCAATV